MLVMNQMMKNHVNPTVGFEFEMAGIQLKISPNVMNSSIGFLNCENRTFKVEHLLYFRVSNRLLGSFSFYGERLNGLF